MIVNKAKNKNILLIIIFLIIFILSFLNFTKVHADGIDKKFDDPKTWPKWTQTSAQQSWNVPGIFGVPGPNNEGCYVTSQAIQGARSGIKKTAKGDQWNPGTITKGDGQDPALGQSSYAYDGGTFKSDMKIGSDGDFRSAPAMGENKAKSAIQSIIKAGKYPILHMDSGSGYPYLTHYVAVRKLDGNNVSVYDPALDNGKNSLSGSPGKTFLTCAAWIEGWGGGPKTIDKAESPVQDGSNDNSSGGSSSKSKDKGNSKGGPEIKPTFNPFRMATPTNTTIGYDTEEKNSADNRGSRLEFMDKWGPVFKTYVQDASLFFVYFATAYIIIVALLQMLDEFILGGFLAEKASGTAAYKILFPANTEFGSFAKFKRFLIVSFITIFVTGLIFTDTLSIFLGDAMLVIGKLFEGLINLL